MRLIPREEKFFDLLEIQSQTVLKGARMLLECLERGGSIEEVSRASAQIHEVEHDGDDLVHQLMDRLNKTFITPLDREDIHVLTVRMDDILDYVDSVAKRLVTFKISNPTHHAIDLARILFQSSEEVCRGVSLLRDLRKPGQIMEQCAKINQLENDADAVMREALNSLFNGDSKDPIEIIKWKDIYEHLEIATDKCEDVANVFESVLVKYS